MVTLAVKTLAAIKQAMEADNGNAYKMWLGRVLPHLPDAYRQDNEPFRGHLGASSMGRECARAVWYGFRWTTPRFEEARKLRLLNRGHLEEGRFIALLLTIGCQIYQTDANGKQFRISDAGGHVGGSGDGVVMGCPDLPAGLACLSEFKTSNDKNFKKLVAEGVRASKFEHYVQIQAYMRKMGLTVALYMVVNKNDDDLYAEIVQLDPDFADRFIHRAVMIVPMHTPPDKIKNAGQGWNDCKFCDHKPVCLQGAEPARNCRTCEFAEPDITDGSWKCESKERQMKMLFGPSPDVSEEGETFTLTKSRQFKGCKFYQKSRAFLPQ